MVTLDSAGQPTIKAVEGSESMGLPDVEQGIGNMGQGCLHIYLWVDYGISL